jgi:uncharacterized protein (DUF1919 family)
LIDLKKKILRAKLNLGLTYEAYRLPERPFSIISDDCWGGQIYRYHKLPYLTPTVGLQILHSDFINFIKNLKKPDFLDFQEVDLTHKYPAIRNPYALLLCVHYENAKNAIDAFQRRYARIVWDNIFYKIDFGKPWYSQDDVNEWNSMALPKSIALTYRGMRKRGALSGPIHNEVRLQHWWRSGTTMYFASRRYFDLMGFLGNGKITKSTFLDDCIYKLFTDIWWPSHTFGRNTKHHDSFARRIDRLLATNPKSAPQPHEVETD